jgi:hypothetical protein
VLSDAFGELMQLGFFKGPARLAADSWMVSRARNWNALLFCMIALLGRVERSGGVERTRVPYVPLRCGKGLGAWGLLPLEGFGEALQTQVVVPLPGELLVLLVQAGKVNVVAALDGAAPLL